MTPEQRLDRLEAALDRLVGRLRLLEWKSDKPYDLVPDFVEDLQQTDSALTTGRKPDWVDDYSGLCG